MLSRRVFLKLAALSAFLPRWVRHALAIDQFFAIPPTVHHVTETTATLYFRFGILTADAAIEVLQDGQTLRLISFVAEPLRQQIVIDGLEPASTYGYRVLSEGLVIEKVLDFDEPWTDLSFTTPPYGFPLKVAAVGDSGFGTAVTIALAKQMDLHDAHLFFHLGDVVYRLGEYENDHFLNWYIKYFQPFATLLARMPHYATVGNHEYDAPAMLDGIASYYWMFPPFNEDQHDGNRDWFSFDLNGIQFLSLNSQFFYSSAQNRDEQNIWLDEKLARQDVLYTVVFCHIAPYTSTNIHPSDGAVVAASWVPKFEASNVALVMSGHAHIYERLQQNGIHYVVAGAGSEVVYGEGERLAISQTIYTNTSFPIFEFYEDRIHLTAYTLEGDVIEAVDLTIRG